jgi:phosphohistidine phosphatase
MTRQLLLMRHAKSDWSSSGMSDKDRPLNARGRAAAPAIAEWLSQREMIPDLILCSAATRTRQTLARMTECWNVAPTIHLIDELYLATDNLILSTAKQFANECDAADIAPVTRVLILGHNPGMELLASKLRGCTTEMPTASVAAFDVADEPHVEGSIDSTSRWPLDWSDPKMWKWGGLVKPRELGLGAN